MAPLNRKIRLDNADARSVHTDALATLGTIIDETAKRDAIHVAVEPAVAAHPLRPGDDVGFVEGGFGICDRPLGIVDPFLKGTVAKGQRFWLLVYPRQINSLRHVWSHPAFEEQEQRAQSQIAQSEAWLRDFCSRSECPSYERLLEAATNDSGQWVGDGDGDDYYGFRNDGEYLHFGGSDAHGDIPDEFWHHIEVVTGKKITKRAKYFSCSC